MEIDKALTFLEKYNYNYSVKDDCIFVLLGLSQQIKLEFHGPYKIVIKDKLVGYNYLTSLIEMSHKNALIYNFFVSIVLIAITIYSENKIPLLPFFALFLFCMLWTLLFSMYYLVKFESFKIQILDWMKE
jgi:hypothetical protein